MCPLLCFLLVMSLLLQILKSRVSLIVVSVFMKVKTEHYLHFQLKWGKYQGEENTLIGSTLTINLRATVETKAHLFIFMSPTHWIPVSPSSCCFTPVFSLQLYSSALSVVIKWCLWKPLELNQTFPHVMDITRVNSVPEKTFMIIKWLLYCSLRALSLLHRCIL